MTDFLRPFWILRSNVKLRSSHVQDVEIDNVVFRMHYKATAWLLFLCSILVTSRQYIGEHIKCIVGHSLSPRVVSSYCFFMSTFTVEKYIDPDSVRNGSLPHLGVGPFSANSTEPVINHKYYQWVPFVLFGQGLAFIITHLVWKTIENGRLKALLKGVENCSFALSEKEIRRGPKHVPSIEAKRQGIALIRDQFMKSNYISRTWPIGLITCEILNVLHVILEMYITDKFLGGIFWSLGPDLMDGSERSNYLLDMHFPKVSKCSFQKYGPSGTLQYHDVLCVMALNVMNEKIYAVLWFWFVFLFVLSVLNVFWRLATLYWHGRSAKFNRYVFSRRNTGKLNTLAEVTVTDRLPYKDWLFLKYLGKNVEGLLFKEIVTELTDSIHQDISANEPDELYRLHQ